MKVKIYDSLFFYEFMKLFFSNPIPMSLSSFFILSGATVGASPAEVAAQASKIVTMLPSSPHVKAVYNGEQGIYR